MGPLTRLHQRHHLFREKLQLILDLRQRISRDVQRNDMGRTRFLEADEKLRHVLRGADEVFSRYQDSGLSFGPDVLSISWQLFL